MYQSRAFRGMILAIVVLTIAAATPQNTVRTLHMPERKASRVNMVVGEQVYSWYSKKWRQEAENGNLDKMYRVGLQMMSEHIFHNDHIPYDPEKGRAFLDRAAEEGHAQSRLHVWRLDGQDPQELAKLAESFLDEGVTGPPLRALMNWLWAYGVEECSTELAELSRRATNLLSQKSPTIANEGQAVAEEKFSEACGNNADSLQVGAQRS